MIRIMFIIPYEEMEREIAQLLAEFSCEETIEYRCALHTYQDLGGYRQEWPCDVIIARGYSADAVMREVPTIPVVKITFTSADALHAIQACREKFHSRRIAIIGHPSLAIASETIHEICDIPIEIYTHAPEADIPAIVHTALDSGNDTIIGGGAACLYAESLHVNNFNSLTDRETLYRAVVDAVQRVQLHRQEEIRLRTLRTIMDVSGEGLMLTDCEGRISVCNKYAELILRAEQKSAPEKVRGSCLQLLPELQESFFHVRKTQHSVENEIFRRAGKIYAANIVPVLIGGQVDSIYINFRDISSIQETENQIRKKLSARGMVTRYQFEDIIHQNARMEDIIQNARSFARVDSNVLIYGETGTGKELFAQSIHAASRRSNRPFIAVNCAAIPEHLLESEMFGYSRGAFTGSAKEGKQGLFELAHGGTLFLDEISELPYSFQGKLLRVLQEREIRRIGDDRVIPVDVRIIAATNRNLEEMVSQSHFRRDLFYRLNVLCLFVPPLRQRPEDIAPIFQFFLRSYSLEFDKPLPSLSTRAQAMLREYRWLGNIRELRNVAERLMVLYSGEGSLESVLESSIFPSWKTLPPESGAAEPPASPAEEPPSERDQLLAVLRSAGSREAAAEQLGISRSTLWRRMKQLGLMGEHGREPAP